MKNTSRKNILYQFEVIHEGIRTEINQCEEINDLDCNSLIESLEGIKELQNALRTLTN